MNKNVKRAKELVPAIILTILSMIQALAIELFWSRIKDSPWLWQGSWEAAIGWLQLTVVLVGILLVWVFYVSFVLRFSWLPTLEDTLVPFLIGLLQFAMIDLMYPDPLGPWFLMLAAIYGITVATAHITMRRARHDQANAYFFSKVERAGWGDYVASIIAVNALVVTGLALWIMDDNPYLATAALVLALFALFHQFLQAKRYWMHSLQQDESGSGPEAGGES